MPGKQGSLETYFINTSLDHDYAFKNSYLTILSEWTSQEICDRKQ